MGNRFLKLTNLLLVSKIKYMNKNLKKETTELPDRIEINPEILVGKPIIKGTRISVDFILNLFAQGWDEEKILKNYSQLKKEDLRAVFDYAYQVIKDEQIIPFSK